MPSPPAQLTLELALQVKAMVQDYMSQLENKRGPKDRRSPRRTAHPANHCTATSDIPAATNLDTPGTGTATILRRNDEDGLTDSLLEIDVVNRNPNLSIAEGEYFRVEHIFSEWVPHGGGGGDSNAFLFQIVSSDPSIRRALVQIETRTFTGPAFGSTLDDTVVYVYDRMGCLLNEPNVDLTGRWGRAELFIWDSQAYPSWFTAGTEPEKIWLVTALCCPQTSCS